MIKKRFVSDVQLEDELSGADLDQMLAELGIVNLLSDNRRSDNGKTGLSFTPPSQYARGHSSRNSNNEIGVGSGGDELAELTSR